MRWHRPGRPLRRPTVILVANSLASADYPGLVTMGNGIGLEHPDPPGMLGLTNQTVLEESTVVFSRKVRDPDE